MEKRSLDVLTDLHVTTISSVRQSVASLSGGQRQSVAISRAVMWRAKVVILDEPTAALGVAQTAQVLALVKRLREQGLGVVVITHNLHEVFEVVGPDHRPPPRAAGGDLQARRDDARGGRVGDHGRPTPRRRPHEAGAGSPGQCTGRGRARRRRQVASEGRGARSPTTRGPASNRASSDRCRRSWACSRSGRTSRSRSPRTCRRAISRTSSSRSASRARSRSASSSCCCSARSTFPSARSPSSARPSSADFLVNHGWSWYWALVLMLVVGAAIGVFQGFWFAVIGVPSFVVTLAGLLAVAGRRAVRPRLDRHHQRLQQSDRFDRHLDPARRLGVDPRDRRRGDLRAHALPGAGSPPPGRASRRAARRRRRPDRPRRGARAARGGDPQRQPELVLGVRQEHLHEPGRPARRRDPARPRRVLLVADHADALRPLHLRDRRKPRGRATGGHQRHPDPDRRLHALLDSWPRSPA